MYRACILHITNRHNRQSNTKIKVVRRTIRVTTNTYNQTRLRYLLQILHSSTNWKDFCKKNQTFSTLTFKFTTVISNLLKLSRLLHVYSFFCLGFFHTFFEIRGLFGFALFHRCSLHGLLSFLFFCFLLSSLRHLQCRHPRRSQSQRITFLPCLWVLVRVVTEAGLGSERI